MLSVLATHTQFLTFQVCIGPSCPVSAVVIQVLVTQRYLLTVLPGWGVTGVLSDRKVAQAIQNLYNMLIVRPYL